MELPNDGTKLYIKILQAGARGEALITAFGVVMWGYRCEMRALTSTFHVYLS